MNRLLASMALLALLFHNAAVGAAEATGWITHLDEKSDRFYLDDGRMFGVSEDINFSSLTERVRVTVRYETFGDERIATDIELAPLAAVPHVGKQKLCGDNRNTSLNGAHSTPRHAFC